MSNEIIQFENVVKKYPGQEALRGATFKLPRGKVIGIVGPNGSGKSTTLKLIAGLIRPDGGEVRVNGNKTGRLSGAKDIVLMHETEPLYGFYTVTGMIHFFAKMYTDFDKEKALDMMRFMELEPNKRISSLSKGNKGRLKLALAVARRAPLILLDEPLSGLDPMVRESIIKGLISYLDMEKQTVVLTTHEVDEIEPLLDLVVAIKDGQIFKIEEVDTIREEYGLGLTDWMKKVYKAH